MEVKDVFVFDSDYYLSSITFKWYEFELIKEFKIDEICEKILWLSTRYFYKSELFIEALIIV